MTVREFKALLERVDQGLTVVIAWDCGISHPDLPLTVDGNFLVIGAGDYNSAGEINE